MPVAGRRRRAHVRRRACSRATRAEGQHRHDQGEHGRGGDRDGDREPVLRDQARPAASRRRRPARTAATGSCRMPSATASRSAPVRPTAKSPATSSAMPSTGPGKARPAAAHDRLAGELAEEEEGQCPDHLRGLDLRSGGHCGGGGPPSQGAWRRSTGSGPPARCGPRRPSACFRPTLREPATSVQVRPSSGPVTRRSRSSNHFARIVKASLGETR